MTKRAGTILAPSLRMALVLPVIVALYTVVIHWVYSQGVSPSFEYLGYRYREPTFYVMLTVYIFAVMVAFTLPRRMSTPSSVMLWVLYVVTIAPTILMSPYTSYLDDRMALTMSLVVAVIFMGVSLWQVGKPRPLSWSVSWTTLWLLVATFSGVTYLLLLFTQGLNFQFLDILDVYDVRAEFVDETSNLGIVGYLVPNQANVINPLIAAFGVWQRKPSRVALAVGMQLVLYSTTGYKHVLFAILAWLVILIVLRRKGTKTRGSVLLWGASGLILIASLSDELFNSNIATSLFSRRFIFTPGLFTSAYVRFFSENPQVHLGHSILQPFVDYPYQQTPPYVIGEWIAGNSTMASNANLFADGYSNFGWLGMVGAGVVLLVYLRLLDRAAVGLPVVVSAMVVVIPSVSLSNGSVLTSMLTHGLVAAVVLLALIPRGSETLSALRVPKHVRKSQSKSNNPTPLTVEHMAGPPTNLTTIDLT